MTVKIVPTEAKEETETMVKLCQWPSGDGRRRNRKRRCQQSLELTLYCIASGAAAYGFNLYYVSTSTDGFFLGSMHSVLHGTQLGHREPKLGKEVTGSGMDAGRTTISHWDAGAHP